MPGRRECLEAIIVTPWQSIAVYCASNDLMMLISIIDVLMLEISGLSLFLPLAAKAASSKMRDDQTAPHTQSKGTKLFRSFCQNVAI